MSMPFYVAPEQMMKDRADYARKGIARGRALVAVRFVDGIVIVAENPSDTLRKVSEIYDRIAFAGVGKYNEFDQLRVAGVRAADLKGYQYSRDDVDARSLANSYAQMLGNIFTHEMKPMEVEILVAEVGLEPAGDQMFHILYDGTVVDARDIAAIGGDAEAIKTRLGRHVDRRARPIGGDPARCRRARRGRSGDPGRGPRGRRTRADQRPTLLPSAVDRRADGRAALIAVRSSPDSRDMVAIDLNSDLGESFGAWTLRRRRGDARGRHERQRRLRLPRRRPDRCCARSCRRRSTAASRSAPRCRIPTSSGSVAGTSTWRPTSCATRCSTNSGHSTRSPRSPGRRSPTSSRTARSTTPSPPNAASPRRVVAAVVEYDPSLADPRPAGVGAARRPRTRAGLEAGAGGVRRPGLPARRRPRVAAGARQRADRSERRSPSGRADGGRSARSSRSTGRSCTSRPRSLCVHGDTPGAVTIARAVRDALDAAGVDVHRLQRADMMRRCAVRSRGMARRRRRRPGRVGGLVARARHRRNHRDRPGRAHRARGLRSRAVTSAIGAAARRVSTIERPAVESAPTVDDRRRLRRRRPGGGRRRDRPRRSTR